MKVQPQPPPSHNTNKLSNIYTPSDLVIHEDEDILQSNKLVRRININNFSPSTSLTAIQRKSNPTSTSHSIQFSNNTNTKIPKPKISLNSKSTCLISNYRTSPNGK
eukprot:399015_1